MHGMDAIGKTAGWPSYWWIACWLIFILTVSTDFYSPHASNAAVTNVKIAFSSDRNSDGDFDIYTMDPDGSAMTRLADPSGIPTDGHPSWSPDGSRVVFYTYQEGNTVGGSAAPELYAMRADGSSRTNIYDDDAAFDFYPAWSPDGSKIAFSRRTTAGGVHTIYILDVSSGIATAIPNPSSYDQVNPAWSPDGTKIAYGEKDADASYGINIYSTQTNTSTELYDHATTDQNRPAWSPDGNWIAFRHGTISFETDYYRISADGSSGPQPFITSDDSGVIFNSLVYSPDGNSLALSSNGDGDYDIYVITLGTSPTITPLTDSAEDDAAGYNDYDPSWLGQTSSDGPGGDDGSNPALDTTAPAVSIRSGKITKKKRVVRGEVSDASAIKELTIAVLVKRKKRCFWLNKRRLKRGSCDSALYAKAKVTSGRWTYTLNKRAYRALKKRSKRLTVMARAQDMAGNLSQPTTKKIKIG